MIKNPLSINTDVSSALENAPVPASAPQVKLAAADTPGNRLRIDELKKALNVAGVRSGAETDQALEAIREALGLTPEQFMAGLAGNWPK